MCYMRFSMGVVCAFNFLEGVGPHGMRIPFVTRGVKNLSLVISYGA